MTYYRFPRTKLTMLGIPLVMLALQLVARSTMIASTSLLGFGLSQAIMLGILGLCGLAFLGVNRKNLKAILTDRRMLLAGLSALVLLAPMVLKRDWLLMYFSVLLCLLFGIFVSYFMTLQEASRCYVGVMTFLSVYALLGQLLLKPMAHWGLVPCIPFDSPGGWHMFNFGLTFALDKNLELNDALRLFGIFREPGLYQVFLFIAILLNNEILQWEKQWKMWAVDAVLFLALLMTFATGGVAALALYVVFLFFDKGLYRDKRMRLLAIALVLGVAAAVAIAIARGGAWAMELVWMVQKVFQKEDSYTSRLDSIFVNARFFLEHPLVGGKLNEVMYAVLNNTATSPILFACFGISAGCLHVASWVALLWKKERRLFGNLILLVIAFMPFNTQNVMHDLFFWLFPMIALAERGLPMLTRKRG